MKISRTLAVAPALVAALAVMLSACGSSGSGSASSGPPASRSSAAPSSGSSSSGSSSSGSSSSGASGTVAGARAEIAKYMAVPSFTPPGPAVNASKLAGKSILIVMHDTVSDALVGIQKGIQQAGTAAGLKVQSFNGQGTVSTIEQGVQQGINQHVGAIILDGVATSLIPTSVQAAAAAHIPVIGAIIGQPSAGANGQGAGGGIFGMAGPSYQEFGRLMADTAIVHAAGKPVDAVVEGFNNPVSPATITGIRQVFSTCSQCKIVSTQDVEPPSWPTQLAGTTSSLIRANPKVNFVLPVVDTMGLFATSGITQAGASAQVKVISADGSGAGPLALVQSGTTFIADPGASDLWIGWQSVDQALRAMSGMAPGNPTVPIRYLDAANLKGANLKNLTSVYGNAYVAGFKKLWGLP